jgi:hypothetical protein
VSCSGLHCAGCAGGAAVPAAPLAAVFGLAWVAEHLIEVAVISAACGVLAVAAVVALMRHGARRDARYAERGTLMVTRPDALPPPARRRELPPVTNCFVIADPGMTARVIRQALPGTIVEEEMTMGLIKDSSGKTASEARKGALHGSQPRRRMAKWGGQLQRLGEKPKGPRRP